MHVLTAFFLATAVVVGPAASAAAGRIATFSSATIEDLKTTPGGKGMT